MLERPILFSAPMVRAILDGRKTQTRRVMKPQPESCPPDHPRRGHWWPSRAHQSMLHVEDELQNGAGGWEGLAAHACPHGEVGDRLWVRETWAPLTTGYAYAADPIWNYSPAGRWHPSIHMPRAACRLVLEVTDVRVERLQDMEGQHASESDAIAEGVNAIHHGDGAYYYSAFRDEPHPHNKTSPDGAFKELWESINGAGAWTANPWVWAISFKRVEADHG